MASLNSCHFLDSPAGWVTFPRTAVSPNNHFYKFVYLYTQELYRTIDGTSDRGKQCRKRACENGERSGKGEATGAGGGATTDVQYEGRHLAAGVTLSD